jgi:hypothetical protein
MSRYRNNFGNDFGVYREHGSTFGLVLKVAAGLVLGGSVLLMIAAWIIPEKRIELLEDRLLITSKVAAGAVREMFNIADERELRMRRERAQIDVEKARQLESIRLAQKAETEAKQKKDAAFKQFYQKPERCYSPASQSIRIECANEYIRAHREFDGIYQGG